MPRFSRDSWHVRLTLKCILCNFLLRNTWNIFIGFLIMTAKPTKLHVALCDWLQNFHFYNYIDYLNNFP